MKVSHIKSGITILLFFIILGRLNAQSQYQNSDLSSEEVRAKCNEDMHKREENRRFLSLSVWTSSINIFSDPGWGRGQETYATHSATKGVLAGTDLEYQWDNHNYKKLPEVVEKGLMTEEEIEYLKSGLIPVLIVDGFSNHDWKQTTKITKWILEESGRFKVDVATFPVDSLARKAWYVAFTNYAVVIQNTNNIGEPHLRWPESVEKDLEKYVKNGGGLYILHSGNNAFSHWKEYDKMIGLGWRPKSVGYSLEINDNKDIIRYPPGEGEDTGHGERFNAVIQKLNEHPINKNYPHQWQTANTEVYYFPRGPAENMTILSYAYDSTSTRHMWPVEWVVAYGKGRVYNSSLGHLWKGEIYPPAYRCVGYQTTVIRATEWLATGKVTYQVPDNFPSHTALSLRDEEEFINKNLKGD